MEKTYVAYSDIQSGDIIELRSDDPNELVWSDKLLYRLGNAMFFRSYCNPGETVKKIIPCDSYIASILKGNEITHVFRKESTIG